MISFCAVCGCCTRTDIVREHLEDTLRICDVSAKGLYIHTGRIHKHSRVRKWNQTNLRTIPILWSLVNVVFGRKFACQ
jgi:hypothetical protein